MSKMWNEKRRYRTFIEGVFKRRVKNLTGRYRAGVEQIGKKKNCGRNKDWTHVMKKTVKKGKGK